MQKIAGAYRRLLLRRPRLVVVIGSLGKTTTKAAITTALDCPDRGFSYSNYGSSLAENLLRVRPWDRRAVLEVGIAGPGHMAGYARMIRPDIVVVTSIKSDHNRSFPTLLDTRAEKVKMVSSLPESAIVLLNGDDPHVRWMATQTRARVLTFGFDDGNDFRAMEYRTDAAGRTQFEIDLGGVPARITSALHGRHMVYPMLAAAVVAHLEGIDIAAASDRLARFQPQKGRMEIVTTERGITIVNDSQKASIESIYAALDAFAELPARRKIVVLGKIEEPQGSIRHAYRDLGTRLATFADLVVAVSGDQRQALRAAAVRAGMPFEAIRLSGGGIDGVADFLKDRLEGGDAVLIKGASAQKFARIALQLQGHKVSCGAKLCDVKVAHCGLCPLRDAPAALFSNRYIARYFKG